MDEFDLDKTDNPYSSPQVDINESAPPSSEETSYGSPRQLKVIAIMLLASKFKVPVCPHAGGVGLCNYIQHLSAFDYIAVAPTLENVVLEYSDHLHDHFIDRLRVENARYRLPTASGYSITMKEDSLREFEYPGGEVWRSRV